MNVADPPKSILKKKSQFDREADSYLRVKPVKSIRFSLDTNKISRKSSLAASNISLDPKIIKSKKDQSKSEKKRRRQNDSRRDAREEPEPFPDENVDKSRMPKKSFDEGYGDEKRKNNEKKEEKTQPHGNKGDSLVARSIEEAKKNKAEEAKDVKETTEEKPKMEMEEEKKIKKKRRRRRRRKQNRETKETI